MKVVDLGAVIIIMLQKMMKIVVFNIGDRWGESCGVGLSSK